MKVWYLYILSTDSDPLGLKHVVIIKTNIIILIKNVFTASLLIYWAAETQQEVLC